MSDSLARKSEDQDRAEAEILHLMTQDNQPYGSARRCCEECGIMIWPRPQPTWTDDRRFYAEPSDKYLPCCRATREQLAADKTKYYGSKKKNAED